MPCFSHANMPASCKNVTRTGRAAAVAAAFFLLSLLLLLKPTAGRDLQQPHGHMLSSKHSRNVTIVKGQGLHIQGILLLDESTGSADSAMLMSQVTVLEGTSLQLFPFLPKTDVAPSCHCRSCCTPSPIMRVTKQDTASHSSKTKRAITCPPARWNGTGNSICKILPRVKTLWCQFCMPMT